MLSFCERPVAFNKTKKTRRVADFWVLWPKKEEIWILTRPSEQKILRAKGKLYSAFQSWAKEQLLDVRVISPEMVQLEDVPMKNWSTILHFLASNHDQISHLDMLSSDLLAHCRKSTSLEKLLQEFSNEDPVLVQAVVFNLLHKGRIATHDLDKELLDLHTEFRVQ